MIKYERKISFSNGEIKYVSDQDFRFGDNGITYYNDEGSYICFIPYTIIKMIEALRIN